MSDAKSSSATGTTGTADVSGLYRGRFAPTPSGPLHFGSLVAAVGSYLEARTRAGMWLVRVEDLDPPREKPGAAASILEVLQRLGMQWDGDVVYQSRRSDRYAVALERLASLDCVYVCPCTRATLAAFPGNRERPPGEELLHAANCRRFNATEGALRFAVPDHETEFRDRCQGVIRLNVAQDVGDFVIRRRDGVFAYQLAVVVDDAEQGITDVVRGADLLSSTARQLLLYRALGLEAPTFMHLPLAVDSEGAKLSKSDDAPAAMIERPATTIVSVLRFLRQEPPAELERARASEVWSWALANWRPERFAGIRTMASEKQ